jgi:transketolase
MAILVTGGAGYIGRWLSRELVGRDIQVVALDRLAPDPKSNLPLPPEVAFVLGDTTNREVLLAVTRQRPFNVIVHLAGVVTMGCEQDPDLGMRVNLHGTHNVLEVARLAGIPRVVFASTISVYGPNVPQPITENASAEPLTWYGQSKLMAEQLGLYYQRRYGLDFRAARLAAIVGPFRVAAGSATLYTTMILEKAALGEPYVIEVDERAATPICYARDAARALATLATAESAPSRIYNIGTCRATSLGLLELAKKRYPEAKIEFRPDPAMAEVGRISWNWELSTEAAAKELGWRPAYSLETMAEDLMATSRGERPIQQDVSHESALATYDSRLTTYPFRAAPPLAGGLGLNSHGNHSEEVIISLEKRARAIRRAVIEMVYGVGSGHPGGSLSATDIITAMYFHQLRIEPGNPDWPGRDRFIVSKGHAAPALYAALAQRSFFPESELATFRQLDSRLQGHPDRNKTPGVDMTAGALGHGVAIGAGLALAARLNGEGYQTYVLLGDGEIQAGVAWEGAMTAAKYHLGNLTAILDCNGVQLDGMVADIMPLEPLADKWRAFGWHVLEIDGHDMRQILEALDVAPKIHANPTIIIARTVKGKGVSYMENKSAWHGRAPTKEQYEQAMAELAEPEVNRG